MGNDDIVIEHVPLYDQGDKMPYCVPASIKMVYDFLVTGGLVDGPTISIEDFAELLGTAADGTLLENINQLSDALTKDSKQFIFKFKAETSTFEELKQLLEQRLPVIIWYDLAKYQGESDKRCLHAAVLYGIKYSKYSVLLNDPSLGPIEIPLAEFMRLWDEAHKVIIYPERVPNVQKPLESFVEPVEAKLNGK